MYVIAVANIKGGVGKSTISTHLAAHFARNGRITALADLDPQKSSLSWLKRRPSYLPLITAVNMTKDAVTIPKDVERLVVDAGAAMRSEAVQELVDQADLIVIPTLPSAFDEDGILRFLKHLAKHKHVKKNKQPITFVANRVRARSRAVEHLEHFLEEHHFPVTARLRDTTLYVNAAANGTSIFEMAGSRIQPYVEEWKPLLDYIAEQTAAAQAD